MVALAKERRRAFESRLLARAQASAGPAAAVASGGLALIHRLVTNCLSYGIDGEGGIVRFPT